ncbi:hypothetical protein F5Y19DRAFT_280395 [Xylariaceae sp. FL1651]|nr:hypothetical protein F5Y19DRAFT_280395 [Xylariaceae sp. FL1651]
MADPYPNLKRKAARWQTLPYPGGEAGPDIDIEDKRYSLLLYLQDLDADPQQWDDLFDTLKDVDTASDDTSNMYAVLEALRDSQEIQHDYLTRNGNKRLRRLPLRGNPEAGVKVAEYDELIALARTVWDDPNNFSDLVAVQIARSLRPVMHDRAEVVTNIFDWGRSWAETRYRFLNHALRDDPVEWHAYQSGPTHNKGNAANTLVHESNLLEDCKLVEFLRVSSMGFTDPDRLLFQILYHLTPEEGRNLAQYYGPATGLRAGLPDVFRYCVDMINAFISWRMKVLAAARQAILSHATVRNKTNQADRLSAMAVLHRTNATVLAPTDRVYRQAFLPALRTLLVEASAQNAFFRNSYNLLANAVNSLISSVKGNSLNRAGNLANNARHSAEMNRWPPIQRTLRAPTGAAMMALPRPPPTRTVV